MTLYTYCENCKNEINLPFSDYSRTDIMKKKGDFIELSCKKCWHNDLYHLNKIKAKKSQLATIVSLVIFIVGTPLLFYYIGNFFFRTTNINIIGLLFGFVAIPTVIYNLIQKEEKNKVINFNRIKIKDSDKRTTQKLR